MARREAILRLHKVLVERRAELHKRLVCEFGLSGSAIEITAQLARLDVNTLPPEAAELAKLEARELIRIGHALQRLKEGTYGICEVCQAKIPVARLHALPYSVKCMSCQRKEESEYLPPYPVEDTPSNGEE